MKVVGLAVAAIAVVAGIVVLREATMSRHEPLSPGSAMEVVLVASSNGADQDLAELVGALFSVCQLEVATDPAGPPARDGDTFTFRVQPALDDTDQRQLRGCLQDAHVDHLRADVTAMRQVGMDADDD